MEEVIEIKKILFSNIDLETLHEKHIKFYYYFFTKNYEGIMRKIEYNDK